MWRPDPITWGRFPESFMRILKYLCLVLTVAASGWTVAADLRLQLGEQIREYSSDDLLARPDVRELEIPADVAYQRNMRFLAVPLAALLQEMPADATLQVVALDGFAAEILAEPLLNTDPARARAWLAIEDPAAPWPPLSASRPSAGPFYLVWTDPLANDIKPEQWPYQIAIMRRMAPAAERFPAMRPAADLPADSVVLRGFEAFRIHCMVCHTLNRAGDARMGPDLNLPYSPVEYMREAFLTRYIRAPQQVRHWPEAKMPSFPERVLSDADLQALLAYLSHMAQRKAQPATP